MGAPMRETLQTGLQLNRLDEADIFVFFDHICGEKTDKILLLTVVFRLENNDLFTVSYGPHIIHTQSAVHPLEFTAWVTND